MSARRSIADLSADLADRAESFCRQYFPEGRKQGNYWQVGDTSGTKGQSLAIRLQAQDGRKAGFWTDYATGQYGDLIDLLHGVAGDLQVPYLDMPSQAGHDAYNMSRYCPTALIFSPCRDGITHNNNEHIELGYTMPSVDVLLNAAVSWANRPAAG